MAASSLDVKGNKAIKKNSLTRFSQIILFQVLTDCSDEISITSKDGCRSMIICFYIYELINLLAQTSKEKGKKYTIPNICPILVTLWIEYY